MTPEEHEEQREMVSETLLAVGTVLLTTFKLLNLTTHMNGTILDPETGDEFTLTFKRKHNVREN